MTAVEEFKARLASDWLPSFCGARASRGYFADGFRWETANRVSEFDARWFLTAVDSGLVTDEGGFFVAPMSKAREQLFWSGPAHEARRSFTLWIEPIITIGTLARLNVEHGWPRERLGCQSKDWGLDLVCYDEEGGFAVGAEIKKSDREIAALLGFMLPYAAEPAPMPTSGSRRNAFKKVASIRANRPSIFWVVGPAGFGTAYRVVWQSGLASFALEAVPETCLDYRGLSPSRPTTQAGVQASYEEKNL